MNILFHKSILHLFPFKVRFQFKGFFPLIQSCPGKSDLKHLHLIKVTIFLPDHENLSL